MAELGRITPNGFDLRRIRQRLAHKHDPWSGIGEHATPAAVARKELGAFASSQDS